MHDNHRATMLGAVLTTVIAVATNIILDRRGQS